MRQAPRLPADVQQIGRAPPPRRPRLSRSSVDVGQCCRAVAGRLIHHAARSFAARQMAARFNCTPWCRPGGLRHGLSRNPRARVPMPQKRNAMGRRLNKKVHRHPADTLAKLDRRPLRRKARLPFSQAWTLASPSPRQADEFPWSALSDRFRFPAVI